MGLIGLMDFDFLFERYFQGLARVSRSYPLMFLN
jgi:hypothetical protein